MNGFGDVIRKFCFWEWVGVNLFNFILFLRVV